MAPICFGRRILSTVLSSKSRPVCLYVLFVLFSLNWVGVSNTILDARSQHSKTEIRFGIQTLIATADKRELPPVNLSSDGRSVVVAPHTSPIPIGLYAMVYVAYSGKKNQFSNMTSADWDELVRSEYIVAVSLGFRWCDIQPLPPPAALDFTLLTTALDAMDAACVRNGTVKGCLPVFLKPYFSPEPSWTTVGLVHQLEPTIGTNKLGMTVVVRPHFPNGTDVWNKHIDLALVSATNAIPISTDPVWQVQVVNLMKGINNWLGRVDPNATRVRVVHFSGPVMDSLQMRPGPSELFSWMSNNGTDTLGMEWSKPLHIGAWKRLASAMGSIMPELAKRPWAFDFTVLPPKSSNASALSLDTDDQHQVFDTLVSSHPAGPGAVIAKTESLHVDLATGDNTCEFKPDLQGRGSFATQYLTEKSAIPYNLIGSRGGRHGWENFAPLAMASLPHNQSNIPSMFPVSILANFSMYKDMNTTMPTLPQGTLWGEVWRHEAINTSSYPSCEDPVKLFADLRDWDRQLRFNYQQWVNEFQISA